MYLISLADKQHYYSIYQIYKPFVIETPISFETTPPTLSEFTDRIKSTMVNFPWLVCLHNDEVIGFSCASRHRYRDAYKWTAEVSVYVETAFQKRKVATGLYIALFEVLKAQNIINTLAGITLPNNPSVSFHESMGFKKIAEYENIGFKLGKWHHTGWWQKSIGRHERYPKDPLTIDKILHSSVFTNALQKGMDAII
jgi:phosphinothricin acetyltransferase